MLKNRPCGACNALVSAETGCSHWKPTVKSGKRIGWQKGRSRSAAPTVRPLPAILTDPLQRGGAMRDEDYKRVLDRGVTGTVR